MPKRKRHPQNALLQVWIAQHFAVESHAAPRQITRQMSRLVCYPRYINDVGRRVMMRRVGDGQYAFVIEQRRYLGRGAYALSAFVEGHIEQRDGQTQIKGAVRQGRMTLALLTVMSAIVLASFSLVMSSILFLPLALLMLAVIALQWGYLIDDRRQLREDVLTSITDCLPQEQIDNDALKTNLIPETKNGRYQQFYQ